MGNKKIVYIGGFKLPNNNAAANRVRSNGKVFNSLGYETIFLGLSDDSFSGLRRIDSINNMFEKTKPQTNGEWFKRIFSIKEEKTFIDSLKEVKAVVLYNMPFFTTIAYKFFCKKQGIELIYDCTEWTTYTDGSFLKKIFKFLDEFLIRNFLYLAVDKLVVISSTMANKYKNRKPLIVVPPLVDLNDSVWHQKNINNNQLFTFCYAGIPDGNKESIDLIVKAFCNLNIKAYLVILGVTQEQFINLYPQLKKIIKNNNKIIFKGLLSHSETIKYILNSDCFIFIREKDRRNNAGFPTKFVESFTSNIPVIAADISDIKKYATNDTIYLINDISVESVISAMDSQYKKGKFNLQRYLNNDFHYENYKDMFKFWIEM